MGGKQTLGIGKAAHGCSLRDLLIPDFSQHWLNYFKKLMDKKGFFSKNIVGVEMIK